MSGAPESIRDNIFDYYKFYPAKGIVYVAFALYALAVLIALATTIRTRRWYVLIAPGVGIAAIIGYAFRLHMLIKGPSYGEYVAQNCLLIIPPSFLAFLSYLTLGKIVELVRLYNPNIRDFLKPGFIKSAYFVAELASLGCQGAGVGLSVSTEGVNQSQTSGRILLIIGLAFLVVILATFLVNAIYVNLSKEYAIRSSKNLSRAFIVLYCTGTLLLIRNIFRLVEFALGFYGPVATREVYFYVFDSLMTVSVIFIVGIFNYGFFFNGYVAEQKVKLSSPQVETI